MTKFKQYRLRSGLTLKQAGQRVGRSLPSMSMYENGKRKLPVATAKKLAGEFGCDWSELYEEENDGQASVG